MYVMIIKSEEMSPERLVESLDFLARAAKMGHSEAQNTFGALRDMFGYPYPVSQEVEIEWLLDGSFSGNPVAQKRLQMLDPRRYEDSIKRSHHARGRFSSAMIMPLGQQWDHEVDLDEAFRYIHFIASIGPERC